MRCLKNLNLSATTAVQILNIPLTFVIFYLLYDQILAEKSDKIMKLTMYLLGFMILMIFFIAALYLLIRILDRRYKDEQLKMGRIYMFIWTGMIIFFNSILLMMHNVFSESLLDYFFYQFISCFFNMTVSLTMLRHLPASFIDYNKDEREYVPLHILIQIGIFIAFVVRHFFFHTVFYYKNILFLFNLYYGLVVYTCALDSSLILASNAFELGREGEDTPSWETLAIKTAKLELEVKKNENARVDENGPSPKCKICRIEATQFLCHWRCNHLLCFKCAKIIEQGLTGDSLCLYCNWLAVVDGKGSAAEMKQAKANMLEALPVRYL